MPSVELAFDLGNTLINLMLSDQFDVVEQIKQNCVNVSNQIMCQLLLGASRNKNRGQKCMSLAACVAQDYRRLEEIYPL